MIRGICISFVDLDYIIIYFGLLYNFFHYGNFKYKFERRFVWK